jgi:hypothetical protein
MSDKKEFAHILSKIKIGPVELKNRIALAPMNETMSGVNGESTEQMLAYFAARAKGGAGFAPGRSWALAWPRNLSGAETCIFSTRGICRG